jgi:hypothetical protein
MIDSREAGGTLINRVVFDVNIFGLQRLQLSLSLLRTFVYASLDRRWLQQVSLIDGNNY